MKSSRIIRFFFGSTLLLLGIFSVLVVLSIVIKIDDAVEATGTVETEVSQVIRTTSDGIIDNIMVQDGSSVTRGTNLVSLNNETYAKQLEELQLNLLQLTQRRESLELKLGYLKSVAHAGEIENLLVSRKKMELMLQGATAEKSLEEIEKSRMAALLADGLVSQRLYDQGQLRYQLLEMKESQQKESLVQVDQEIKTASKRHAEELAQLELEITQNRIEADKLQLRIAHIESERQQSIISAPKDGVIFIGQEPEKLIGQTMRVGDKIADLIDSKSMIFQAVVPETSIRKLQSGQNVNLEITAFPYQKFKIFKGVVTDIAQHPTGGKGGEAVGYRVKVKLQEWSVDLNDEQGFRVFHLKPGFSGIARIIVSHDLRLIRWLKIQVFGEEI